MKCSLGCLLRTAVSVACLSAASVAIAADGQPAAKDAASNKEPAAAKAGDSAGKEAAKEAGNEAAKSGEKKAATAKPEKQLSPEMASLRDAVRQVLTAQHKQGFNTRQNTAGEILNVCRAFGCGAEVSDDAAGSRINAITCLCWNYPCGGFEPLAYSGRRIAPRIGYGRQERPGEMLAVLAMARVADDYPVRVGNDVRKISDLIEAEKLGCRAGGDSSYKLIALAYYVEKGEWKNDLGETWSVERMIDDELDQQIASAPEGGLTRLAALGYAVRRRSAQDKSLNEVYRRAQKFVNDYQEYALALQNADGSWGPYYLKARGEGQDAVAQLHTTGRVLEWLTLSMPEEKLQDRRVVAAVECLARNLGNQRFQWSVPSFSTQDIASWARAISALARYDERVFRPFDGKSEAPKDEAAKTASR